MLWISVGLEILKLLCVETDGWTHQRHLSPTWVSEAAPSLDWLRVTSPPHSLLHFALVPPLLVWVLVASDCAHTAAGPIGGRLLIIEHKTEHPPR